MTKIKKRANRDAFHAMAARIGELPTTILASAQPVVSDEVVRAARVLVGGLGVATSGERIERLASKLQDLVVADREAQRPARSRAQNG
jgi:hypothetical protein